MRLFSMKNHPHYHLARGSPALTHIFQGIFRPQPIVETKEAYG
jgi:hypothetical protein